MMFSQSHTRISLVISLFSHGSRTTTEYKNSVSHHTTPGPVTVYISNRCWGEQEAGYNGFVFIFIRWLNHVLSEKANVMIEEDMNFFTYFYLDTKIFCSMCKCVGLCLWLKN